MADINLLSNVPDELRKPAQWVQYYLRANPKRPDKKPDKCPCLKWGTPEVRKANLKSLDYLLKNRQLRAGFQRYVDKAEGFVYFDLDNVRADSGVIKQWALDVVALLDTYTEISSSGTGLRLVCRARLDEDFSVSGNPLEIYAGNINKLMGVTGNVHDFFKLAIEDRQAEAEQLLRRAKAGEFGPTAGAMKNIVDDVDEPDINDEDDTPPEFPRVPGALGQLVEGITSDIPYEHKALAAVTYMGIGLAKRISLIPDHWLQPRFYACLVATASGGKSAAEFEVRRALLDHNVLKDLYVELSIDSGPALVQALEEHRRLILAPDELADQFEKARAGATGRNSLFGELLRLFESNETGNHTKQRNGDGGRVELHDALFALIGGTTTERFEQMFHGTGAVASGLQSRFVLSHSDAVMPRLKTPNDEERVISACAYLAKVVASEPRRLRLSEAAQDAIMDWRPFEDDGAEKMKRVLDMAKRFALVVAACQQTSEIDDDTMRLALQFADYQIALREKLFPMDAATYVQAFENRIIRLFEKYGRFTEAVLQRNIKPERLRGGYAAYNRAWSELLRAGRIKVAGLTRAKTAVFEART